jgi:charged multivesicular body protein 6
MGPAQSKPDAAPKKPNAGAAAKGVVKVTAHDRAVLELKLQRDKLTVYQKKMDLLMDKETDAARELLANGQRDRALFCLRRKKCHALQLERSRGLLENVYKLISEIEFVKVEKSVFDALKEGTKTLQEMNKELSVETVEQVMEDAADAIMHVNEVSELLGGYLGEDHEREAVEELTAMELTRVAVPTGVIEGARLDDVRVPAGPIGSDRVPEDAEVDAERQGDKTLA